MDSRSSSVCLFGAVFKWVSKVMLCLLWFFCTSVSDWLKKLAPLSQPIRSYQSWLACTRCPTLDAIYFDFWLVHFVFSSCCDWIEKILWFWFSSVVKFAIFLFLPGSSQQLRTLLILVSVHQLRDVFWHICLTCIHLAHISRYYLVSRHSAFIN